LPAIGIQTGKPDWTTGKGEHMRTASALLFVSIGLASLPAQASTWNLDPAHSSVGFSVRHMMVTTVKGQFEKVQGVVELDDKDITKSTVEVTVDVASLNTHEPKRDAHLKSADFFDVEKFPTAVFKSTKVQKMGKNKLKVTGDLTLHGITKPVVLEVEGPSPAYQTPFGTTVRGVQATGKLDRKAFNVNWNKTLDNGGVLVGNEVTLDLNAELVEKGAAKPAK
jgi:polyisoprenoid-binding protein YceI